MKTATLALAAILGFASPAFANTAPMSILPPSVSGVAAASAAQAQVVATVSISQQRMFLSVVTGSGETRTYQWKVSTGRTGFDTPLGAYHPTWLDIDHRSKTYDNAPMPFAVFFTGGYAIHATEATGHLGRPASHGCVRLAPQNAAAFYKLVATYGRANTEIVITD